MSAKHDEPELARHGDTGPRPSAPSALELLRWSATLIGVSLLVAAVAIPLLRWLGVASG